MKKLMNNYRKVALALGTVLTLGISNLSYAGNHNDNPAELKFIGNFNSLPVFQLVLTNSDNAEYTVTVRDSEKKVLLYEKLSGKNISRRYKLDAEEISLISGTTFEVTNKKTKETHLYEIGSSTSYVENVSISKL